MNPHPQPIVMPSRRPAYLLSAPRRIGRLTLLLALALFFLAAVAAMAGHVLSFLYPAIP